jgi:hypothetical protein
MGFFAHATGPENPAPPRNLKAAKDGISGERDYKYVLLRRQVRCARHGALLVKMQISPLPDGFHCHRSATPAGQEDNAL